MRGFFLIASYKSRLGEEYLQRGKQGSHLAPLDALLWKKRPSSPPSTVKCGLGNRILSLDALFLMLLLCMENIIFSTHVKRHNAPAALSNDCPVPS